MRYGYRRETKPGHSDSNCVSCISLVIGSKYVVVPLDKLYFLQDVCFYSYARFNVVLVIK